jgi:hypothetical protein
MAVSMATQAGELYDESNTLSTHFKRNRLGFGFFLFAVSPGCTLRPFCNLLTDLLAEVRNFVADSGPCFFATCRGD